MVKRSSKKSETLQVRLPYGMKRDFMDRVKLENRSASDLVRDFIEGYLAGPVEILNSPRVVMIRRRVIYPSLMAAGLVGAVIIFMPNPGTAGTLRSEFDALDTDRDGFITAPEFQTPSPDAMLAPAFRPGRKRQGPDGINMHAPDGRPLRPRLLEAGQVAADAPPGEVFLTREQLNQHMLNFHDMDDDQKLSFDEYRASRVRGARDMFDRADLNLDDRISEDEYLSVRIPALNPDFMASLPAERQAMARRTIEPVTAKVRAVFQAWDADKDGYVTRQEMIPS